MPWAEMFILDAVVIIAVLIYYRHRPKPRWLQREIRIATWIARALRIIRRIQAL